MTLIELFTFFVQLGFVNSCVLGSPLHPLGTGGTGDFGDHQVQRLMEKLDENASLTGQCVFAGKWGQSMMLRSRRSDGSHWC